MKDHYDEITLSIKYFCDYFTCHNWISFIFLVCLRKGIPSNDAISSSQEPQSSPQIPAVVKPRRGSIFVSALAAEQHGASTLSTDNA